MAWGISIGAFIFLFALLTTLPLDGLLAFIIALAAVGCLFFFYLDRRAIGIQCPHCKKYVATNTPWICGNKDTPHRNDQVDDFPFIHQCQHCGFTPKAYQCHHCFKLIYLSEDRQETAYARCADIPVEAPKPKPVKRDPNAEKITKQTDEKGDLKHELETTLLKGAIKEAKSKIEPVRRPTITDRYNKSVKDEDEARRLKAAVDEEFKNDPVEREKRHRMIDEEFINRM